MKTMQLQRANSAEGSVQQLMDGDKQTKNTSTYGELTPAQKREAQRYLKERELLHSPQDPVLFWHWNKSLSFRLRQRALSTDEIPEEETEGEV